MGNYQRGLSVGAVAPGGDWTITRYASEAKAMAQGKKFAVVAMFAEGASTPSVYDLPSRSDASDAYDRIVSRPGKLAYVAAFQDGEAYDEALLTGVTQVNTVTKTSFQSVAGWAAAGLAAVFGIVVARRNKRRA